MGQNNLEHGHQTYVDGFNSLKYTLGESCHV
jgi:hypothetical protein